MKHPGLKLLLASLAAPVLFTGCQSPDVYYWGHYEDLVYTAYAKPDKAPPDTGDRPKPCDACRSECLPITCAQPVGAYV